MYSGILSGVTESVSRGRPCDGLYPAVGGGLGDELAEGSFGSHGKGGGTLVDTLDESREDTCFIVSGSGGQQGVRRVPGDVSDGRGVLLDVLGDPPIVIGLERADGDEVSATSDGELVLVRGPFDVSGGTVDSKNHKNGLPYVVGKSPHVSVTILRAGDDTVGLGGPVYTGNDLIVLSELGLEGVGVSCLLVNVNLVVVGAQGYLRAICIPCMAGDRADSGKLANIRHFVWL